MAIFAKEIIFITILLIGGALTDNSLSPTTDATNEGEVRKITTENSTEKSEIMVDVAIKLTEAIKIINENNSGLVQLNPAVYMEKLLKEVPSEVIGVPLTTLQKGAPILPITTTRVGTTTMEPTTKPESITSPASETTTSPASETTTSPASETTTSPASTSPASEPTSSSASQPTTSPAPEPTTSQTPTSTTPKPKPKPTAAPHHGLTRGEIAALVIFVIILFGVASGVLIFYIRRRRMADESYTQLVR